MHRLLRRYIFLALILVSGCSTTNTFSGTVRDTRGKPLQGVNVQLWQNQWIPFYLPERIAEIETDSKGRYNIKIKKRVSFIVYEDSPITFSKSVKPKSNTNKHYHEIEIPKI